MSSIIQNFKVLKFTSEEEKNCKVLDQLVKSYFSIVRKSIQDAVPKAVMHMLVNFVMENVQSELLTYLYKPDGADALLDGSEQITLAREDAEKMLSVSSGAKQILTKNCNFVSVI